MSTLQIKTAKVFEPLLKRSRYKAAHGGRGSGKSHFFAELLIEDHMLEPGLRSVGIREVQRSLKESSKRLIEDKLTQFGLGESDGFKVFNEVIQTPGDGVIVFNGMQNHTADSIKSLEGFGRAWVAEAQSLSARSLMLLRPTLRSYKTGSEERSSQIWFDWNPRRKADPVDLMFRGDVLPTDSVVVKTNWSTNPYFPKVLDQERLDCLNQIPDQYDHIWQGGYATVLSGAYFAKDIQVAREDGRIGIVGADPLMTLRLFMDIGGTGAKADAFTIWVVQFVGKQIRVLDYYESVGQPLATHLDWMRLQKYSPEKAQIWLPHDGSSNDRVYDVSFESAFKQAGYEVTVVTNQGKGAAKARIESIRRTFPSAWFNETTTEGGLSALGWYHEKKDEERDIGLGPDHDWSSHGADAYGLMSIVFEGFGKKTKPITDPYKGFR